MPHLDPYNVVGLLGAGISILCYALVQWRRDFAKTLKYSILNACAAIFVCISLIRYFNVPSLCINIFWFVISLYGIYRCTKYARRSRAAAKK